jgi:hypothetical protein
MLLTLLTLVVTKFLAANGALPCGVHCRIFTGLFSHGVYTPSAEKCDVEHVCFHSVRLLRDPSFGYPEHSNWQRGFWQCSNFTGFTHPTKQTNKQTNNKQTNNKQALGNLESPQPVMDKGNYPRHCQAVTAST